MPQAQWVWLTPYTPFISALKKASFVCAFQSLIPHAFISTPHKSIFHLSLPIFYPCTFSGLKNILPYYIDWQHKNHNGTQKLNPNFPNCNLKLNKNKAKNLYGYICSGNKLKFSNCWILSIMMQPSNKIWTREQ